MSKPLIAKEGMIITDGKIYGKVIHLADGLDESNFYEITQEKYNEILAQKFEKELEE